MAFQSSASNLVSGDRNGLSDIFVGDLGALTTSRVSVSSSGIEANGSSDNASISADGRYVTLLSSASNLVPGDANGVKDVFVRDRATGSTTRVSVSSLGAEANVATNEPPAISADGRYVVFASQASNLVAGDANGVTDVFVHDRTAGTTTRVSMSSFREEANSSSLDPTISDDGRFVAFRSSASNLVPNDFNRAADVFVHELSSGRTSRVSVTSAGVEANDRSNSGVALSADGRYVAFDSMASNLIPEDFNLGDSGSDVFLHDRNTSVTQIVSVTSSGFQGAGPSSDPSVSDDGRYIAFHSNAALVGDDTNSVTDVFVRDRGPVPAPPAIVLDQPAAGDRVFAIQTLAATVDSGFTASRVDFLVDGAVIGSDTTAPYSIQWDTTTRADGDHSISAKAVSSTGSTSQSQPVVVAVINGAACDERLHADFDAGKVDVDTYVKTGMYCLLEPRLLSQRHSSPSAPGDTEGDYYRFIAHWPDVSPTTQDEIAQFFADFDSGFYWTEEEGAASSPVEGASSGASSSNMECTFGLGFLGRPKAECVYTTGRFVIKFAPEGFRNGIPMFDGPDENDVPDLLDRIENSLRAALAKYTNANVQTHPEVSDPLGYRAPEDPVSVVLGHHPIAPGKAGFAPPPPLPGSDIYLAPDAYDGGHILPRHELFHVIQWRYAGLGDYLFGLGTRMWVEATAEWASDQSETASVPSDFTADDADNLPAFLGAPYLKLNHVNNDREYGAFIFAKYLEQRFGTDFIRRSWQRMSDTSEGALEAIDSLLLGEGVASGLSDIDLLPDFWERSYRLEPGSEGYLDPDLTQWKIILSPEELPTAGDATESSARPWRRRVPLLGGKAVAGQTVVEAGGAFFVDFVHDYGRAGTMRLAVANRTFSSQFTSEDVRLTLLSFGSYPSLCRPAEDLVLSEAVAKATIQLDPSCRFSTLVVAHTGAIGGETLLQDYVVKYDAAPQPGDVFASLNSGFVNVYRPDGTQMTTLDTKKGGNATGSAFDAAGNFYVTNFDATSVTKFGPDGSLLGPFGSGYTSSPESILLDSQGNAYVGHANGTKDVHKLGADGSPIQAFDVAVQNVGSDWIALRPDECTLVYTSEGTRILQYDVCGAQQLSDFGTSPTSTFALGLLPDGGLVVSAKSVIRRLDAQGSQVQTYDASGVDQWFALGLDPGGTSFWAGNCEKGKFFRFDLATGQVLLSIDTGATPARPGDCPVGGISVRPDTEGPSAAVERTGSAALGFWAPSPGRQRDQGVDSISSTPLRLPA